jgi:molybdenum cofactor cytidylyltransferase
VVRFVENERPEEGMSSSIRAGVASLPEAVEAVVVLPADQPTTGSDLIVALCRAYRETGASVVAPLYRGEQGPPVLFARSVFAELMELRGDRGARAVLDSNREDAAFVPVDEPMPRDVDTRADHEALESLLEEGG